MAEKLFPEGALVCLTHDERNGKPRSGCKDQLPGKIVGVLKSMPNRDDVELMVSIARPVDAPGQEGITTSVHNRKKVWTDGPIEKKRGKEIHVFPLVQKAVGKGETQTVDWRLDDLPYEREENPNMPDAWKFIKLSMEQNGTDSMALDDGIWQSMYPNECHYAAVWKAWLQVKFDYYFHGDTPEAIHCHNKEHVEARDWGKGTVQQVDMTEHENREAARAKKADDSREARKRLLRIMNLRASALLKTMTDREITAICGKAVLQRYEEGDQVVTQGIDRRQLCIVVAGELDAVQRFGSEPFEIEESQLVLTPGKTFAEEAILHTPARMTVRALKACEVALVDVRHCEFLVNESPDALKSIQKLLRWEEDHKDIFDLLMQRKTMLLKDLKDQELRYLAKYVTLKPITKDTLLCREGDQGDSMFIVARGYVRAYNEIELTAEMKNRRNQTLSSLGDGSLSSFRKMYHAHGASQKSFSNMKDAAKERNSSRSVLGQRHVDAFKQKKREKAVVDKTAWPIHPGQMEEILEGTGSRPGTAEGAGSAEGSTSLSGPSSPPVHAHSIAETASEVSHTDLLQGIDALELGGQVDVVFSEGAVAVFGEGDRDMHIHRHEVNVFREGECFEETAVACGMLRQSSVVALAGSIVGVLERADLKPVLLNNPTAHHVLEKHWKDVTPLVLVAEAVSKKCPSAVVPKLDEFEIRRLNRGAILDDWEAGHEVMQAGKPNYSIFMVLDGELSVTHRDEEEYRLSKRTVYREVAVLGEGKIVGEVGMIVGAKATSTILCKTPCALIELPEQSCEGLILSRPDLVDYIHHLKMISDGRGELLELMCEHVVETNKLYEKETEEHTHEEGSKAEPPFFSSWSQGTTVEVVEISPPVFGNVPSPRGRYERADELLDDQAFKKMWRGFDTLHGIQVAWNRVYLSKLSTSMKMQFLAEVKTLLRLTNDQPSWLRYDLRENANGDVKFFAKWHLASAVELPEFKADGLSPRLMPLGEARASVGMSQSEFEATTALEAWRALRPFETEKPSDWDEDDIPQKFLTKEMIEARRNKPERVFHAPSIIKCFSSWEDEETNSMVFITELIEATHGVGKTKRAFSCLQLGNYVTKKGAATANSDGTLPS